jgi:cytochrome P450
MLQAKLPPGPRGNWLIGNLIPYARDPLGFATRLAREYGDVVRVPLPRETTYMLSHPDDIEYVLRGNHRNFVKDRLTHLLSKLLGQGLLTSEGDFWRRQRSLAQPAFQLQQIGKYGAVMVSLTQRLLDSWRPGQRRNVHDDMMHVTLEIAAKTLFDADVGGDEAEAVGGALETAMAYLMSPITWTGLRRWLPSLSTWRFNRAVRQLDLILTGIIRRRRQEGRVAEDLLSRLLTARSEDGSQMTDEELRNELMTLFMAGHETTALALSYSFYLVSQHPDVEERLAAEVDEVLESRPPTVADVPRLRFTEWIVKESMRLYPPAWAIGREPLEDCEIGRYFAPKGTQIMMNQWVVHRDSRWFDDPLTFKPERWDNDLARRLPRCAYFPFGDGPRICIGNQFAMLETVLVLATITQRYRLVGVPGYTLQVIPSITLRPKGGIPMILEERQARRRSALGFAVAGAKTPAHQARRG